MTATGLKDTKGNKLGSASLTFGLSLGDVNGDGIDHKDAHMVSKQMGRAINAGNFRAKVASDRSADIDTADANAVMQS